MPVIEFTEDPVRVIEPPRLTLPPPDKLPEVLMVIAELDSAEFGRLVMVLVLPDIVLLVNV